MRTNRYVRKLTVGFAAVLFAASLALVSVPAAYADGVEGDPPPPPKPSGYAQIVDVIIMSIQGVSAAL